MCERVRTGVQGGSRSTEVGNGNGCDDDGTDSNSGGKGKPALSPLTVRKSNR
jgi:hypothetical protein